MTEKKKKYKKNQLEKEKQKRQKAEKKLLFFKQAIESASDAIVIANEKGERLYFNPAFSQAFEWPLEEMRKEEKVSEIFLEKEKEKEMFEALWKGESWSGEMKMKSLKSDREMHMLNRSDAITGDGGELLGIFSIYTDITERKEAEEELASAHQELQKAHEELELRVQERTQELRETLDQLRREIEEKERVTREKNYLYREMREELNFGFIIGQSPALEKVLEQVEMVAPTEASVLITGESGTGKELIARAIHENSPRRDRPLVKVNCASIPTELFESEFFGHVKGAFTGAIKDRAGRFELAHGGTLFLDEVGEIPLDLQSKLLRVIQEGEFERVGEPRTREVDVRIVAATNRNLKVQSSEGAFRKDLFYRLSVFPIEIPPLRQRKEDIYPLAQHFLKLFSERLHLDCPPLKNSQIKSLESYSWPGNIRELQNVIERAVILSQRSGSLQFSLGKGESPLPSTSPETSHHGYDLENLELDDLDRIERDILLRELKKSAWKIYGEGGAAQALEIPPTTLVSKMKRLGIKNQKKFGTRE